MEKKIKATQTSSKKQPTAKAGKKAKRTPQIGGGRAESDTKTDWENEQPPIVNG